MTKLAIHSIGTGAVEGCECRYCAEPGAQDGFAREEPEVGSSLRIRLPAVVSAAQGVVDSVAEEVGAAGNNNTGTAIISVGGSRTDTWFGLTRISNADIDDLAACLPAAHDEICFSAALDKLRLCLGETELWRRVAGNAFDHPGYLPSIEAARRDAIHAGDHPTARTPGLWSDRSVRELVAERDALVETNAILNRGCAAVYAEVKRLRSEITISRDARAEVAALRDERDRHRAFSAETMRHLESSRLIVAAKDARIAELKSRLACEQNKPAAGATPDRNGPAVAGPTNPTPGGPQAPGQHRPAPQHNPFRDFPSDRRQVGA